METPSGLKPQFNTYDQQKCFIAYTHKASWSEDILAACTEVLPRFGLEAWYADDQFEPGRSLKEKVVEMIANARYGIFDLSAMYDNERKEWVMPRNVLIELGIAIALNRPVLLLRSKENRMSGCPLPTCLSGIDDIIEFSGEPTLKRALEERIPQWINVSPDKMWWTRYCLFGGCNCEYREVHPRMERWQHEGLHCHIADGPDTDRPDFRETIEEQIKRYNDLTFAYLDACKPTHPYHFVRCAHCQAVRSSQFAIYRITPQTDAETYIAIGMSIALETQFGYDIPKIFFTADVREVPSLLSGCEVIEAVSTKVRKQRLRKALPVVMQRVQECAWNPRVLPFEVVLPIIHIREDDRSHSSHQIHDNSPPRPGQAKILIATENDRLRRLLVRVLVDESYSIFEAHDGAETLKKIQEYKPDICLIDIYKGNLNGFDVLQLMSIDPILSSVKVIMLTSPQRTEDRQRALTLGARACLTMPFELDDFLDTVEQVLKEV